MAEKLYYSMSEVAEMFDVNQSLIRYWESKFDSLRPKKNKKGNRMFRPEDIENFKIIYHLVKECGMTLDGAKRAMKQQGAEKVSRNAELLEKLQSVRSMLAEVREILKDGEGGALLDEDLTENEEVANAPETEEAEKPKKSAVKVIEPKQPRRKKKKEDDQRPLFAFYEQTLF
jgi:DNA-binding transcriptional MerR regulator